MSGCSWHLGSNRALELVIDFTLPLWQIEGKSISGVIRFVAFLAFILSHTGCFGLPDLHGSGAAHDPVTAL